MKRLLRLEYARNSVCIVHFIGMCRKWRGNRDVQQLKSSEDVSGSIGPASTHVLYLTKSFYNSCSRGKNGTGLDLPGSFKKERKKKHLNILQGFSVTVDDSHWSLVCRVDIKPKRK